MHDLAIYVAIIIAYYGLLSVLVYYTYQMKVVLMKLEETNPTNYYKGAQRANYACLAMYLAVFISFTLEVIEKLKVNQYNEDSYIWLIVFNRGAASQQKGHFYYFNGSTS